MGRKGGGRKAFLKTAKNVDEESEELKGIQNGQSQPSEVQTMKAEEDPSSKFLVEAPAADRAKPEEALRPDRANGAVSEAPKEANQNEVGDETKGQLVQRHKKEMKAHKEQMKKLGKKRKDEVEKLDQEIETRHNNELLAWESQHEEKDLSNTSLVAPTVGLYDLKIGESDDKQPKKPTKAQKRREQREAEEAEREARIAAEQASLGPDEREVEAAELNSLLQPLGLKVKDIPADGHCMYRSVQDQLEASGNDPGLDYAELRQETASYMRAFPDTFLPFVNQEDGSERDPAEHFEEYCDNIEETAAWGGQIELQALAQAIERHILVHCAGLPVVEQGMEYKGKLPPIQICYLRHAYALGEHYNSLRPVES